jgi:ATP-dependent DNA helicase RecQ
VLGGEGTVTLRRLAAEEPAAVRRSRGRGGSGRGGAGSAVDDVAPADRALVEALRAERAVIAHETSVPAYVVMHDSTLRALAAARPVDHAGLLRVSGIGVAKAEKYGDRLLAVIGAHGD